MRRNQRGEVAAVMLLAIWVAGIFGYSARQVVAEHEAAKTEGTEYRIGIDYGGRTTSVCEER